MDTIISYDAVVALVANLPIIVPHPNFTNLRNLRCHIQRALMPGVSCPQSNILGWAGLIMSRAMYGLLTTSLFRILVDPGLLAIYYLARSHIADAQGNPFLNWLGLPTYQAQPAINQAEQATIDARFERAKTYWESYQNIRCAVFDCLNNGIDAAFKISNNSALTGWNPLMKPREMFDQITATYGQPTPAGLLQNDMLF
jgi:hypothetical protein